MNKVHLLLGLLAMVGWAKNVKALDEQVPSFADEIAPVLVSQCLACHNARTAKGRFSVETYQSLMRGGESGDVVSVADPDFSTLLLLLESGEMPKDGDPLSDETIDEFKLWIASGAKLNDGAEPSAPLTAIIPKPVHPTPPITYTVSIPVNALAYRPGTAELATSGYHEVLVFDSGNGSLVRRIANVAERVLSIAFAPDGSLMAVAAGTPGRYGEIRVFDAESGELIEDLVSSADCFWDVAFSKDGSKLAAAGSDRAVRVWSVSDWKESFRIENHSDWVTSVAFSADGRRLATGSRDKTAKVFDVETQETLATFNGHTEPVTDVLFLPDGNQVVSCGLDKEVRWWKVSDAKQRKRERLEGPVFSLHPIDAQSFACGTSKSKIRIFRFEGDDQRSLPLTSEWVSAVSGSADGSQIAVGTLDGQVMLVNGESGELTLSFQARPSTATAD